MKDELGDFPLAVSHKRDLNIRDLQEELGFRFGEEFELLAAADLGKQPVVLFADRQNAHGPLVFSDIGIIDLGVDLGDLFLLRKFVLFAEEDSGKGLG